MCIHSCIYVGVYFDFFLLVYHLIWRGKQRCTWLNWWMIFWPDQIFGPFLAHCACILNNVSHNFTSFFHPCIHSIFPEQQQQPRKEGGTVKTDRLQSMLLNFLLFDRYCGWVNLNCYTNHRWQSIGTSRSRSKVVHAWVVKEVNKQRRGGGERRLIIGMKDLLYLYTNTDRVQRFVFVFCWTRAQ